MVQFQRPEIAGLAYIGIQSDRVADWDSLATGVFGMQGIDKGGAQRAFRMDDRAQRLIVDGTANAIGFFGWEVTRRDQLDVLAARLEAAGHKVTAGDASLRQKRMVADLIWLTDPGGYRVEICWNPVITDDPFIPGRAIAGFKTGPMGMGHIVLNTDRFDAMMVFYQDLLRFGVSDYFLAPFPVYFFHVNGRHHSFALAGSGRAGMHHFMVEMLSLDDVGQGYDIAGIEDRVAYTLGRHANDWMTSFYTHTPSGFFVEYGWGARAVEPASWVPEEMHNGPSFWGHERLYMEEADAKVLRDMRMDAARQGLRAGDIPVCAWASSIIAQS